ncbi:DIP1984 family protein [Nocardia alni]|uniref:DIP1984 family protein n=1 Tax=Nocardia alni TaxID=2815723 RepID=UPI001C235979|nr:DIP1984 family protein [Nocardia alni]
MSTGIRQGRELAAAHAERDRLRTVDEVLADMADAATSVWHARATGDGAGERAKLAHFDAVASSVWIEQGAASACWAIALERWLRAALAGRATSSDRGRR